MKFKTQGKGMSIDISFPCVFLLIMMSNRMKDEIGSIKYKTCKFILAIGARLW